MGKKLWQCTNKFLTWTYCKQKCLIKSTQTCLIKTKYRGSHRKRRYLLERFIAKINSSEQTMNHCQHVWSFRTAICYLLSVHIYTWTKSCVTQEKIGRLALCTAPSQPSLPPCISFPLPIPPLLQHLFPTFPIHQLAWLPPSNPPPCLLAISPLFLFRQRSLRTLSFSPSTPLPASPSTLLWTWPWIRAPRGLSLGRCFDLWLGKCFEASWEGPGAWTGVLCLDLLSTQKMGETGAPLMLRYLNWQCSFSVVQLSIYTGYTDWEHGIW